MASGFWYLKDGRGFAKRLQVMIYLLKEIHHELKQLREAKAFADYLSKYIPTEEHEFNGYGGFFHLETGRHIMMVIDFREFTPTNQALFWQAAQKRLDKFYVQGKEKNDVAIALLSQLLRMRKKALIGEDPMLLNDLITTIPPTGNKLGPGWSSSHNIKFHLGKPKHGWLPIQLEYEDFNLTFEASDVPNHCINELIQVMLDLETKGYAEVEFHLEPNWIKFNFEKFSYYYSLEITDEKRIFIPRAKVIQGSFKQLIEPFIQTLKQFTTLNIKASDWEMPNQTLLQNFEQFIVQK